MESAFIFIIIVKGGYISVLDKEVGVALVALGIGLFVSGQVALGEISLFIGLFLVFDIRKINTYKSGG